MSDDHKNQEPPDHDEDKNAATGLAAADEEVPEAIKAAPPQAKRVMEMMAATFSSGHLPHPLFDKLEGSHIDKFLDYGHEDDRRWHEYRRTNRWFHLVYFIALTSAIFALIWILLPSNEALLQDLLKFFIGLVGGFGAGYGYRARSERRQS